MVPISSITLIWVLREFQNSLYKLKTFYQKRNPDHMAQTTQTFNLKAIFYYQNGENIIYSQYSLKGFLCWLSFFLSLEWMIFEYVRVCVCHFVSDTNKTQWCHINQILYSKVTKTLWQHYKTLIELFLSYIASDNRSI